MQTSVSGGWTRASPPYTDALGTGESGAANAGLFAVQILALKDATVARDFAACKEKMAREVEEADQERNRG